MKAVCEKERAARGRLMREARGLASIWSAPVAVESTSEPNSEEPTPLSDPRIVEVTRYIEALTLLIQGNHERNRARHPNEGVVGSNWEKLEGLVSWRRASPAKLKKPLDKGTGTSTTMDRMGDMERRVPSLAIDMKIVETSGDDGGIERDREAGEDGRRYDSEVMAQGEGMRGWLPDGDRDDRGK